MKVALVTNWGEKCAVAEYARNLTDYCLKVSKDVEFKIVTRPLVFEAVQSQVADCEVLHFNYCAHAFSDMHPEAWQKFVGKGKPVIWTLHESTDWWVRKLMKTRLMDYLVVHDGPRDSAPYPKGVRVIPFGVPEVDVSDIVVEGNTVGTFGAAYPWKGLYPLAYVCGNLGMRLKLYLSEPDSDRGKIDWQRLVDEVTEVCPRAVVVSEWLPQDEVVRRLASCAVVAFPFDSCSPITGISSSVRAGLASGRPLVLTKFFHFSDLYDYADEVYFVEQNQLLSVLRLALSSVAVGTARFPLRAREDMSWTRSAELYCNLYRQAMRMEKPVDKSLIAG